MSVLHRPLLAFLLCSLLTIPAGAAVYQDAPPPYGAIILAVEDHFALGDTDNSATLSAPEYMAIAYELKSQPAIEARADFNAMDMNGDQVLTLDEFYGEMPSAFTL